MFPGRINPRQFRSIMKQLGIELEELKGAKKVIIELDTGEKLIFSEPSVTVIKSKDGEMFQIVGSYKVMREESAEEISEEDIKIVMEKANVDRNKAIEALKKAKGNPAEAIMLILSGEL